MYPTLDQLTRDLAFGTGSDWPGAGKIMGRKKTGTDMLALASSAGFLQSAVRMSKAVCMKTSVAC